MTALSLPALTSLVLSAAVSDGSAQEQATDRSRAPAIDVSAQAEVRVTPDRAAISLGVQSRAATVAQATADNARRQKAVIDTLRAMGIPAERITTAGYNVHPIHRYDPQRQEEPRIVGYNVVNTVSVEVERIDRIGALIDAGLAKGANNVHSLRFWASNVDEARRRAMAEAVSRARSDAEALARAAGASLGRLEWIQHDPGTIGPPIPFAMEGRALTADAAPTPISPGEQALMVRVRARWLLAGI